MQERAAGTGPGCRELRRARFARIFARGSRRRESMFAPFAAFASLAGVAGLPFISF
jgi:hypothetical protein